MKLKGVPIDEFCRGYLEAALWSSTDPDTGDELDKDYDIRDIDGTSLMKMVADCRKFHADNEQLLGDDPGKDGHDFWLTRNHHGSGFWDRKEYAKDVRDKLTKAAHDFGESTITPGDDGLLHLYGGNPKENPVKIAPSDVSAQVDFDIIAARRFCADLLEDVNDHWISLAISALSHGGTDIAIEAIKGWAEHQKAGHLTEELQEVRAKLLKKYRKLAASSPSENPADEQPCACYEDCDCPDPCECEIVDGGDCKCCAE